MKKEEIKWIVEAFSMQPEKYIVGMSYPITGGMFRDKVRLNEIKLEKTRIDGDPYEYYKGYDEEGNLMFEFKKGTVNVGYY